jgi:type IV pilus assembly protein PilO
MAIGANMTMREQVLVICVVLVLGAAGAFWYFVYSPKQEVLATLSAHVDSVEAMNRQARVDMSRGTTQQLVAAAAAYEQNLHVMRELVPTSNEVPTLLEHVSTAARRVGLDIATVEPVPVIPGAQFDTYRYKISVMGGYHEIARFLTNVGSLDRIVAPVGIEITPHVAGRDQSAKAKPNESLLDAKLQIQTYVIRTNSVNTDADKENL